VGLQRGFQRQGRSPKRKTAWAAGPNIVDSVLSATGTTLWTTGVQLTSPGEVTIARIRGSVHLTMIVSGAAGDGFRGAMGIGLVNFDAFTTGGVNSVPKPLDDEEWDGWMWYQYFDVRAVTATLSDGANAGSAHLRIPIDTKAMRKFNDFMILFGSVQLVESGAATVELQGDTRILGMLP